MSEDRRRGRVVEIWRWVLSLSWPVLAEQSFRALMRTTDILVTGLFSPAAIVAIGLADRYAAIPLRIGLGIGSGAIAISSQDTGSGSLANRNEAVTQAVLIGVLAGLPFVLAGFLVGRFAIAVLGAAPEVAQMGGVYLAVIFTTAPMRHVYIIVSKAFQGTGDTRTPMYVKLSANVINIVLTIVLGLGVGPAPRLGIIGVGIGTAFSNTFSAGMLALLMTTSRTTLRFAFSWDRTVTKQLMVISTPKIGEGFAQSVADFPFNAILLVLGTEVNAGYQIGRRAYQQLAAPFGRAFRTSASIVVGQSFANEDARTIRFNGWMTALLGTLLVGVVSAGLFLFSAPIADLFTNDPTTRRYAGAFIQAYAIGAPFYVLSRALAGMLEGGSDTRAPFIARISGAFVVLVGASYVVAIHLGFGATAVYATIVLNFVWTAVFLGVWIYRRPWIDRGVDMMESRGSIEG